MPLVHSNFTKNL